MLALLRRRRQSSLPARPEADDVEPHPLVALAVGLVYVFRTAAGARWRDQLEAAIRRYSADPAALWRLVRDGEPRPVVGDTTADPVDGPDGAGALDAPAGADSSHDA